MPLVEVNELRRECLGKALGLVEALQPDEISAEKIVRVAKEFEEYLKGEKA